jgi:hypothetical protein
VDMPDAVASRKRQVSRLRSSGSKRASNKSLYKAPDIGAGGAVATPRAELPHRLG